MSSGAVHAGPSFIVSHRACTQLGETWSATDLRRTPCRRFRQRPCPARLQLPQRACSRAHFSRHRSFVQERAHALQLLLGLCLLRRVPGSPSLAGHSIEPHLEQSPGVVPRKPSASGGVRCGVKSSSILGHTHSFDGCMFGSVLTRKRGQQSVNNLGEFLCVRRPRLHEGQRNSQRRRHCFKSVVTSFQAGARRLHSSRMEELFLSG